MSQKNLFSYFSTTPKGKSSSQDCPLKELQNEPAGATAPKSASKSSSSNALNSSGKSASQTPKSGKKSSQVKSARSIDMTKFKELDIVWSKLEGYSWWPSIVCRHPTADVFVKKSPSVQYHVQFFDDPVSRSWIKVKYVVTFTGEEEILPGGQFYSEDETWQAGVLKAKEAVKLLSSERKSLIVELQPSSESDDDDDDVEMKLEAEEESSPQNVKENKIQGATGDRGNPKKKRRIIVESDDSEDEFNPDAKEVADESEDDISSGVDEDKVSDVECLNDDDSPSPVKKSVKRKRAGVATSASMKKPQNTSTVSKLASFSASSASSKPVAAVSTDTVYPYMKLDFLKPENLKDKKGRSVGDTEYDKKTLLLPNGFLGQQTPAMQQWWKLKSENFDSVLFFKMGKFYELFNMDATIGVTELGLIYMKGESAHCGFPEISYGRYADSLVQKGYKVARVEQTETPEMMNERVRDLPKPTKFDKVVRREICRVTTKGTQVSSFLDGDVANLESRFLLAVTEQTELQDNLEQRLYGVSFVDTTIGRFFVGQFTDDRHSSRLCTLLAHYPPAHILYERGRCSGHTLSILNGCFNSPIIDALRSSSEFWESGKTLSMLLESGYFTKGSDQVSEELPEALKAVVDHDDMLGRTACKEFMLGISALGAIVWYLQVCLLDAELLSRKLFKIYEPLDINCEAGSEVMTSSRMILDSTTLFNLDVFINSASGSTKGSLLSSVSQCSTPFGHRNLKRWISAPLCLPSAIRKRQEAVSELIEHADLASEVRQELKKLPDLERLLSKIHTLSLARKDKDHPEARAVYFEEGLYSKRKIEDFLLALNSFKLCCKIRGSLLKVNWKSSLLLKALYNKKERGHFPDLTEKFEYFDNAFDHEKARKEGKIKPSAGVDDDYDAAVRSIKSITEDLQSYLDQQKKVLQCRALTYWGTGKNRFQMEVPDVTVDRVPNSYEVTSQRKGFKRYRTQEIEKLLASLVEAEDLRDATLREIMQRIFASFDDFEEDWSAAVRCIAVVDSLLAIALWSGSDDMCLPEVLQDSAPTLEITDGRHPTIAQTFCGSEFIPNDTFIGSSEMAAARTLLVTGPNMGGKSTLMRQVGLLVIMAQVGFRVPARACRITPVDRIFTRLGAADRIMAGESTFLVELSETSSILRHVTSSSLVLLDELGRGTSTFDGTAIAYSVLRDLSQRVKCLTLFSTHYHSLVQEFDKDPNVKLGHMSCMIEGKDELGVERITFLYKLAEGACPKSYGFNTARLANLPDQVISSAAAKARAFESSVKQVAAFCHIVKNSNLDSDELMAVLGQ